MTDDEPIYCSHCGQEYCACDQNRNPGPYCEVCGVIPREGEECWKTGRPCDDDTRYTR